MGIPEKVRKGVSVLCPSVLQLSACIGVHRLEGCHSAGPWHSLLTATTARGGRASSLDADIRAGETANKRAAFLHKTTSPECEAGLGSVIPCDVVATTATARANEPRQRDRDIVTLMGDDATQRRRGGYRGP